MLALHDRIIPNTTMKYTLIENWYVLMENILHIRKA
jgi:hypothetical protein